MPELTIRQPLTAERLRELADRGLSQTEIATETGYSRQRVNQACRQHGIKTVKKHWRPPIEHQCKATAGRLAKGAAHIAAIRQCAADGMTATEAAAKIGTTRDAIYNATRRHGIVFTKQEPRGLSQKPKPAKRAAPKPRKQPAPAPMDCRVCGDWQGAAAAGASAARRAPRQGPRMAALPAVHGSRAPPRRGVGARRRAGPGTR